MSERNPDEVRAAYVAKMGEEAGHSFYQLHHKLVELHILWQQYCDLFGKDDATVELLNRTAGLFFKVVQDELWDSVLLGISRMVDPPQTLRSKNLTLRSLPALLNDASLRDEVQSLCDAAVAAASFAREHRNKRIAHQDHGYLTDRRANALSGISRRNVEDMLAALRAVAGAIHLHFFDSTMMYDVFIGSTGADLLIRKLRKL
jgi:hypothetical protein